MKNKTLLPMKLQFFAEPAGGGDQAPANEPPAGQQTQQTQQPAIDYDKLIGIVQGKQTVAEDSVLKGYFKQQGLSKEEADQAISQFKAEKAKNQPDVVAIQQQLTQAQGLAQQVQIEKDATLEAIALGIDIKTIPYVLKLADLSAIMGADGKVNQETLKAALNKVLEDVPAFKTVQQQDQGFQQIGAGGNQGQAQAATNAKLDEIFGVKRK